jgi:hypothetical protein
MGPAVVLCTTCRGASQVDRDALGLTVRCPRCDATFVAIEEVVAPPPRVPRNPLPPPPESPLEPRRRPERTRRRRVHNSEQNLEPAARVEHQDHDPHHEAAGSLPASVLIGLALLPFAIPILWLVAPAVTGVQPAMTIATPLALALSASVLCLAVIYTIDWTPATRIKGVLMLVCLAYFGALSLYFLKKDLVDKARRFFDRDERIQWKQLRAEDYVVLMPGTDVPLEDGERPIQAIKLKYRAAVCGQEILGQYRFVAGSGPVAAEAPNGPKPGSDEWFDAVVDEAVQRSGGKLAFNGAHSIQYRSTSPGREFEIMLPENAGTRIVRLYLVRGRLYYLSAQGIVMSEHDPFGRTFFGSFQVVAKQD